MLTKDRTLRPTVDLLLQESVIQNSINAFEPLDLLEREDLDPQKALLDFKKISSASTQDQTAKQSTFEKEETLFGRSDNSISLVPPIVPNLSYHADDKTFDFDQFDSTTKKVEQVKINEPSSDEETSSEDSEQEEPDLE